MNENGIRKIGKDKEFVIDVHFMLLKMKLIIF